jgi:hypothetical protein
LKKEKFFLERVSFVFAGRPQDIVSLVSRDNICISPFRAFSSFSFVFFRATMAFGQSKGNFKASRFLLSMWLEASFEDGETTTEGRKFQAYPLYNSQFH